MKKWEEKLNEPQRQTLKGIRRLLPGAHFVDIKIRINGQDKWFEADFLKDLLSEE